MSSSPPAPLSPALIRRWRLQRIADPQRQLPVRSTIAADLRLFLLAWAFGFVGFLLFIA